MNTETGMAKPKTWMLTMPFTDYPTAAAVYEALDGYSFVGQLERGEDTGYLHWQVFIRNKKAGIRFDTLKARVPTAHLERTRTTSWACYEYVTKLDTRVSLDDPEVVGIDSVTLLTECFEVPPTQKGRSSVQMVRDSIFDGSTAQEILLTTPEAAHLVTYAEKLEQAVLKEKFGHRLRDELVVEYRYGKSRVGKTYGVYNEYGFDEVYRVSHYGTGMWDRYSGEPVLLLDEFSGQLPLEFVLQLLDVYPLVLPARFSDRQLCATRIIVVSNAPLDRWYPDVQREYPDQFEAFKARFNRIVEYRMDKAGKRSQAVHYDNPRVIGPCHTPA